MEEIFEVEESESFNFAQVPNNLLNMKNVSLRAKGLYGFLKSKPPRWKFTTKSMSSQLKEGIEAIRMAIIELEDAFYLERIRFQNEKGFWQVKYKIYTVPEIQNKKFTDQKVYSPEHENPELGKPYPGNPDSGNRILNSNNDYSKKDKSKKEINISFDDFYNAYGKKVDGTKAKAKWALLTDQERELAMKDAPIYNRMNPDKTYQKSPATYINNKSWLDERPQDGSLKPNAFAPGKFVG